MSESLPYLCQLEQHAVCAPMPPYPSSSVTAKWVDEYANWFDQLNILVGKEWARTFDPPEG